MVVTWKEYEADKQAFFEKHDYAWTNHTTPMDEYGRYWKTYIFDDGAEWYEAMAPVTSSVEVEVHKVKCKVDVKLLCTEYWSSESASKYYYEKF